MKTTTNQKVNIVLDVETGFLHLTHLEKNTLVYLYDEQGKLQFKELFIPPSLTFTLYEQGWYVIVMVHSACKVEVRRIAYQGIAAK